MPLRFGVITKNEIILYGYRQFHYPCKNRRFYEDITKNVGERFDTSKYELKISLLKVKKNLITI